MASLVEQAVAYVPAEHLALAKRLGWPILLALVACVVAFKRLTAAPANKNNKADKKADNSNKEVSSDSNNSNTATAATATSPIDSSSAAAAAVPQQQQSSNSIVASGSSTSSASAPRTLPAGAVPRAGAPVPPSVLARLDRQRTLASVLNDDYSRAPDHPSSANNNSSSSSSSSRSAPATARAASSSVIAEQDAEYRLAAAADELRLTQAEAAAAAARAAARAEAAAAAAAAAAAEAAARERARRAAALAALDAEGPPAAPVCRVGLRLPTGETRQRAFALKGHRGRELLVWAETETERARGRYWLVNSVTKAAVGCKAVPAGGESQSQSQSESESAFVGEDETLEALLEGKAAVLFYLVEADDDDADDGSRHNNSKNSG